MAVSTPASVAGRSARDFARPRGRALRERSYELVLLAGTAVAIVVLAVLLVDILIDGAGRLRPDFLTSYLSRFADETGIRSGLTGTLSLMVLVCVMSLALGVGAAVYLEEFARDNRFTRLMEANISNLAAVPSVIYGLLGLGVFVYLLGIGRALMTGALTLTLLILPVIIVASREAIRAVPRAIRDAGLALGATPLQVTTREVLPSAFPGILTGVILAVSRAIGEAAPILVAGAVLSRRADNEPWNFLEAYTGLPVQIFNFVQRPQHEFQVEVAAAGIIVLLAILLLMNSVAIILRNKYQRSW